METRLRVALTAAMLGSLTLAGCGGGGGGDDDSTSSPPVTVSSGIISFELPTDEEIAALPAEARDLLSDVIELNENGVITPSLPASGSASYLGDVAIAVDNVERTVVVGDAALSVADFSSPSITGEFRDFTLYEGSLVAPVSGSVAVSSTSVTGSEFTGTMSGTVSVGGDSFGIGGSVDGAFAGAGADQVVGILEGTVTNNADSTTDPIAGAFLLDKQ